MPDLVLRADLDGGFPRRFSGISPGQSIFDGETGGIEPQISEDAPRDLRAGVGERPASFTRDLLDIVTLFCQANPVPRSMSGDDEIGALMLWKKLVGLCAVSLSGVALTAPAATAAAPIVLSASAETGIQSCVGETVSVTDGQFNVVYMPGSLFHRNIVGGRAVGDITGTEYRLSGHIQQVDHLIGSGGETVTFLVQLNVVATVSGASFRANGLLHLTFNPAGELVAYSNNFSVTCG